MILVDDHLYAATDKGAVEVFSWPGKSKLFHIQLPPIKDFAGDLIEPKIYSVDISPDVQNILIVSQGLQGFSDIYLYSEKMVELSLISGLPQAPIRETRFTSETTILAGTLSNELIAYDLVNKKILYREQINTSTFSDLHLNNSSTRVVVSDESGDISLVDVGSGSILRKFKGQNLDKVFQLDFKAGYIVGGSQDRRISVYNTLIENHYFKESVLPVYCVALSPDASLAAFSTAGNEYIRVFDVLDGKDLFSLPINGRSITKILFVSGNELLAGGVEGEIMYWTLPL